VPEGTDGVILELGAKDALRGLDPAIPEKALDQIALTAPFKNRPKMADVFSAEFLPAAADRKID
jgi:acyl-CoA thioesterase-1